MKERFSSRLESLVENEAVRLGETFQVANRWCSLLAVAANGRCKPGKDTEGNVGQLTFDTLDRTSSDSWDHLDFDKKIGAFSESTASLSGTSAETTKKRRTTQTARTFVGGNAPRKSTGSRAPRKQLASKAARRASPMRITTSKQVVTGRGTNTGGSFRHRRILSDQEDRAVEEDHSLDFSQDETQRKTVWLKYGEMKNRDKVLELISAQEFEGFWKRESKIGEILGVGDEGLDYPAELFVARIRDDGADTDVKAWVTLLVIVFLEKKMVAEKDVWDFIVEKARDWLAALDGI